MKKSLFLAIATTVYFCLPIQELNAQNGSAVADKNQQNGMQFGVLRETKEIKAGKNYKLYNVIVSSLVNDTKFEEKRIDFSADGSNWTTKNFNKEEFIKFIGGISRIPAKMSEIKPNPTMEMSFSDDQGFKIGAYGESNSWNEFVEFTSFGKTSRMKLMPGTLLELAKSSRENAKGLGEGSGRPAETGQGHNDTKTPANGTPGSSSNSSRAGGGN